MEIMLQRKRQFSVTKSTLQSQKSVRSSVCYQNPSTAWNHHPSSSIILHSSFLHFATFRLFSLLRNQWRYKNSIKFYIRTSQMAAGWLCQQIRQYTTFTLCSLINISVDIWSIINSYKHYLEQSNDINDNIPHDDGLDDASEVAAIMVRS